VTPGRADVPGLYLAVGRATVAGRRIAVIALLSRVDDAVAAGVGKGRRAGAALRRAAIAGFDRVAVRRAPIARNRVAVVARLPRLDDAVATDDGGGAKLVRGRERRNRRDAFAIRLQLTGAIAAVARLGIAVVALLARLDDAVAAILVQLARRPGGRARVAHFDLTGRRAPIARHRVAVVAGLVELDDAVAAHRRRLSFGAHRRVAGAAVAGLHHTSRGAAVSGDDVAVIAPLVAFHFSIAADHRRHARLSGGETGVPGLELAHARAAVAWSRIAVVAGLSGLDDTVAADRSRLGGARCAVARRAAAPATCRAVARGRVVADADDEDAVSGVACRHRRQLHIFRLPGVYKDARVATAAQNRGNSTQQSREVPTAGPMRTQHVTPQGASPTCALAIRERASRSTL